ncbi:MAG: AAA family ATPase [Sphaerochaetaceae bacterium]|nr:AAA family ATPase [Spirochaetales bacterium]MDY5498511.1 AAA family ATPase [Sphaerochaetaceae bacterium]
MAVVCLRHADPGQKITTSYSSFETVRKEGHLYVDKTAYLHSLVRQEDNMCFLSRPRRFGKTLTVSTLEAIFQGRRELFKGLAIDQTDYDWKTYPIIHIDFGNCREKTAEGLESWLKKAMIQAAVCYGIAPLDQAQDADEIFSDLIDGLSALGKVVVLIDEYDKVVSDNALGKNVGKLRDTLRGFYQVIKAKGELLRFVFMTGVTKHAKMGVFSGLNNLNDLSLAPAYATMLGRMKGDADKVQAFLLQTGYLTIESGDESMLMLRFPNAEVRNAYSKSLLRRLYGPTSQNVVMTMEHKLKEGGTASFMELLAAFFAQIVDALVAAMGADVRMAGEDRTSAGRIDLTVETGRHVYVMECKADKSAEAALRQIKEKRYADKFRLEKGKTIHLLGIAFSSTGHTVQDWKEEVLA